MLFVILVAQFQNFVENKWIDKKSVYFAKSDLKMIFL